MNKSDLKKILTQVLKKEARPEGLEILSKSSEKQLNEFLDYYNKGQENICCLVLDSIKIELVKSGKMIKGDNDFFGHYPFE